MAEEHRTPILLRPFKWLWLLAVGLYRTIFVLLMILLVVAFFAARQDHPLVQVKNGEALVIAPSGELVDELDTDSVQRLFENWSDQPPPKTALRDVIDALEIGAGDTRVPVAVLKLDDLTSAGMPQIEEINAAIEKFRAAGKPVYAWAPSYDQTQYLLASQADKISVDPLGMVLLEGLSVYNNYFREALDKLGVNVHVFRVGEYKAAVEPFLRNDMSPEAREADREWLNDLWGNYTHLVATARKLPEDAVGSYVSGLKDGLQRNHGDAAAYAKETKIVDAVEKLDEFRAAVGEKVGMDDESGSFRQINFRDYLAATRREQHKSSSDEQSVALVSVQGDIVDGQGEPGMAGGDMVSSLLSDARRNSEVAAVVLRVDSPGGSVYAAEQIRREVDALQDAGKPVVVSMGSVAASGGYWVSMDADEIWAHDSTVTGSIGIFGMIPTFEKPLEKLGIHTDGVGTTSLAGSLRLDRPIGPEVSTILQSEVDYGYQTFINGVASGRDMNVEDVDKIARGRVWSGAQARKLGLVDEIGSLDDAIASAAKMAGLEEGHYQLQELKPETLFPIRRWLGLFGDQGKEDSLVTQVLQKPLAQLRRVVRVFGDPRGVYAHCFCVPSLDSR
ncbi:MAG TPA: signal peptide peptidase SppA [Nevskiaceae bacterium]|nr:signal peptide peptidase SppA [Nevskiaceae bacterium]